MIDLPTVKKLTPPEHGNRVVWDNEIPGFGVRITSAGVKSFVLSYRIHGRKRRYTIGRYPELTTTAARDEAIELRQKIRKGQDPFEEKHRSDVEPTVYELAKQYLERHALPHKRTNGCHNDQRMIDGIIQPQLGSFRVKAVGKRDIEALHNSLRATPYRANRVRSLLSKMFALAMEWGWRLDNPVKGVPKFQEDRRERWLSVNELRNLNKALDSYADQSAANALRLLILTGAREGEVLKADWEQIDLKRGVWTKPSHHTKQKKIEHIPLSKSAVTLLRKMKPQTSGPLFPGSTGFAPRVTLRRPWVQVCKAAGLSHAVQMKGKRRLITRYKPGVRIHDLRHTYASHLVSNGTSLQIVGKLLGHTNPQTTNRYAHVADEALRDATNRFGQIFKAAAGRGK